MGSLTKMKFRPPRAQYAAFHATWLGVNFIRLPEDTFNSTQKGIPFQITCTSGIPPPCLFSIRVANVFFGSDFLIVFQKFASGPLLIGNILVFSFYIEGLRVLFLQISKPTNNFIP